jgi:hypothetical protein
MIKAISNLIRQIGPQVQFNDHITDNIFQFIENNGLYFEQYNLLCQNHGRLSVNRWFGRLIKQIYDLPNTGVACADSNLIKTYTRH